MVALPSLAPDARVTFLTGAGVSVASGIRPYRGPGGVWNEVSVDAWATAAAMARDPEGCFRAHHRFAEIAAAAAPNEAHRSIAELARRRPPGSVQVITQNVDALHQRAGSEEVIDLHGSLSRVRCTTGQCGPAVPAPAIASEPLTAVPSCPRCGAPMRYDIVLFDELMPAREERAARDALRSCDVFIAAGTSGVVFPAASFVREAEYAGARTMLVNLERPSPSNPYFHDVVIGRAEEVLPILLGT